MLAPEPKKRKLDNSVCENCSQIQAASLETLMVSSPFAEVLRTRSFRELNDQYCKLLNQEWTFQPNLRHVGARLLAGCILQNTSNGQADQFTELRQLRTKLHDASTFMLCRTSGHFARHRSSQPYTVFNLVTYDRFRETGKGVAAAIIFNEITQNVLQKGAAGCLKRAVVEDARRQCGDGGKITKAFGDILALFKADSNSLTVLGDSTLNKAARFIEQSFAS
ncbi:hypothetical protein EDD21DRAFT_410399 [Dissophora ornata]|nr:hypothetical protein EDD21DRAFT_410399 [Dissophora ornata]